jgi:hypothetical protein
MDTRVKPAYDAARVASEAKRSAIRLPFFRAEKSP